MAGHTNHYPSLPRHFLLLILNQILSTAYCLCRIHRFYLLQRRLSTNHFRNTVLCAQVCIRFYSYLFVLFLDCLFSSCRLRTWGEIRANPETWPSMPGVWIAQLAWTAGVAAVSDITSARASRTSHPTGPLRWTARGMVPRTSPIMLSCPCLEECSPWTASHHLFIAH